MKLAHHGSTLELRRVVSIDFVVDGPVVVAVLVLVDDLVDRDLDVEAVLVLVVVPDYPIWTRPSRDSRVLVPVSYARYIDSSHDRSLSDYAS